VGLPREGQLDGSAATAQLLRPEGRIVRRIHSLPATIEFAVRETTAKDTGEKARMEFVMTMPVERTRALLWAGGFLIELARDSRLPLDVRRSAVAIARHFPTIEDVTQMARLQHPSGFGVGLSLPQESPSWVDDCRYGPLRRSTRLVWPE
jgi:hypothetical protein